MMCNICVCVCVCARARTRTQNNRENMGNDCSNFANNNHVHASGYSHAVYKVCCIRTFIFRLLTRG